MKDEEIMYAFWKSIEDEFCLTNINDIKKNGVQNIVPFIGSGMSVKFGYPDWTGFLQSVINEYYEENDPERVSLESKLAKMEYLQLADELNQILNNGIADEVRKTFNMDRMKSVPDDENYLSLMKSAGIKKYVTTNFDGVIEKYLRFNSEQIYLPSHLRSSHDVIDSLRVGRCGIVKLHGSYNRHESIIITGKDFENVYGNKGTALREVVDYVWNTSVFLFLGCGLTKDYLIERFTKLAGSQKENWHYAILPYPEQAPRSRKRELAKLKIRPIWYEKGKYEQIQIILKMILDQSSTNNMIDIGTGIKKNGKLKSADSLESIGTNKSLKNRSTPLISAEVISQNGNIKVFSEGGYEKALSKYTDHLAVKTLKNESKREELVKAIFSQKIDSKKKYSKTDEVMPSLVKRILDSKTNYPLSLVGEPGSGKSTILALLYIECLKKDAYVSCLIDTHFYDRWIKKDAQQDLESELKSIDALIYSGKNVILFIDGLNRFTRGDRDLEEKILWRIENWKVYSNVRFVLSIGELDNSLFPPFVLAPEKKPLTNYSDEIIKINPVKNDSQDLIKLIKAILKYHEKGKEILAKYRTSRLDRFCHYIRRLGCVSTNFRTVVFVLNMMQGKTPEEFFSIDIGAMFNQYFHQINNETVMKAVAKYTAKNLLQRKTRKTDKFYYLYKSEVIRNFFFAYYYVELLKTCQVYELEIFDCIFTPSINRFVVDLIQNQTDCGVCIINNIANLMSHKMITLNQKNQFVFLLGRVKNTIIKKTAINILSKVYEAHDWKKRMTIEEAMYIRSVGISLIYLGVNKYESSFYEQLIYNGFMSAINRNFHIQYFLTDSYRFDSTLKLDNPELCSVKNIEGLYDHLYHSIFDKKSRKESIYINVITILNLMVYKIFYLEKNRSEDIKKAINLINMLINDLDLSNNVVCRYVEDVRDFINNGNIYISTLSSIYNLKEIKRAGWISRKINLHRNTESVADHSWACCQLALLFLPERLQDCAFVDAEELTAMDNEYDLSRILKMLIIHDLGEAYTGDIISMEKSEEHKREESAVIRRLVTLDTLPHFNTFGFIDELAQEFKSLSTYNAKLAKDIDIIEPLIQLYIYRDSLETYAQDQGIVERDKWINDARHKLHTGVGKNILNFFERQILSYF